MIYNMDFLAAALIFLLLIFYHFLGQRKVYSTNSHIFTFFIVLGITDILFDILCTVLISMERPELSGLTRLALTMLYLMQAALPYAMFCYTQTLRECSENRRKKNMAIGGIPFALLVLLIFANVKLGALFQVDKAGEYIRGDLYMLMYGYALGFVLLIALDSMVHYQELGRRKFLVIWEFLVVTGICVIIQARHNDLLMTGFGVGLGITVLFLTINNPYGYTDNLTGVFDKQFFGQWIKSEAKQNEKWNLLTVDLVQLKRINKIYGASVGDQLLIRVAKELQDLPDAPKVFRVSGNRFALPIRTLAEYEKDRGRIQTLFRDGFRIENNVIYCPGVICGILDAQKMKKSDTLQAYVEYLVSLAPDSEETLLIQDTDKTMEGFRYEQEIEQFLNSAIEQDLFELYYQPVYSFRKEGYITLEALSRLRHPTMGPVSPEIFIGIAEKNGQIADIGYLQFCRMCRFIKQNEWIMQRIQNVKFNLSPLELLKPGYCHTLIEVIREFDLSPSYFQFEITETVATDYCDKLYQSVSEFQEAGIGLCLDDFGSGYANINTVLKLPFSSIKLDHSLLAGICEDKQIASFYRSIVSVLKNLGYSVIAEGVENEEEVELLHQWGVDMIQGYYFSPPVSGEEIVEKLK